MKKRRTESKIKRLRRKNELGIGSGEFSRDDKLNADDLVGVHKIGSEDTQRHFGTSKIRSSEENSSD